jgi:hypothetical protein
LGELLLYGLDEAGETAFTERVGAIDRASLRALAAERLRDWHAVEIWDGPMCVVRLRRQVARQA